MNLSSKNANTSSSSCTDTLLSRDGCVDHLAYDSEATDRLRDCVTWGSRLGDRSSPFVRAVWLQTIQMDRDIENEKLENLERELHELSSLGNKDDKEVSIGRSSSDSYVPVNCLWVCV